MRKFLTLPLMVITFVLAGLVASPTRAAEQTPDQIAQSIVDELGKTIEGHRDELKSDRAKLVDVIDDVFLRGAVKVLPVRGDLNAKRTIARTQITLDDGKLASVDFAFRKTSAGEWKAYDVIIEGISYITNYRNQVAAEIQKDGIESLITRLQTQGDKALESMDKEQKS